MKLSFINTDKAKPLFHTSFICDYEFTLPEDLFKMTWNFKRWDAHFITDSVRRCAQLYSGGMRQQLLAPDNSRNNLQHPAAERPYLSRRWYFYKYLHFKTPYIIQSGCIITSPYINLRYFPCGCNEYRPYTAYYTRTRWRAGDCTKVWPIHNRRDWMSLLLLCQIYSISFQKVFNAVAPSRVYKLSIIYGAPRPRWFPSGDLLLNSLSHEEETASGGKNSCLSKRAATMACLNTILHFTALDVRAMHYLFTSLLHMPFNGI